MAKKAPLILVDGSSYLFRAFHALPPLTNSNGQPTGAIYGVINMLKKLVDEYKPEYMAVVFDAKGKTFRSDLYKEYKAHRPPMPDDLRSQIEPIHQIVDALGYPRIVVPKVEADDVIGTLARQAEADGFDVLISTGDKDLAQLVTDKITLINTMNNHLSTPASVLEKFGVSTDQIIDYLALIGDTADNIPGINKVGPKTAVKWLAQYESVDNIIAHADEFKGKVGEYLREGLEQLPLSYQLATIVCDVELDEAPKDLQLQSANTDDLKSLYSEFELKSWLTELGGESTGASETAVETDYQTVLTQKDFDNWLEQLKKADMFAFDTETTSLNYMQARVVGVSFSVESGKAAYVPFGHDYEDAPQQLSEDIVLGSLKPLLEDPSINKLGQNLKYDAHVLQNHDIQMQGISDDTLLESFVLDSTKRHDMDSMASRFLNHNTIHFEDIAGKGVKQLTFNQVELDKAGPYAAEDADITLRLHQCIHAQLKDIPELLNVYKDIELPLMPIIQHIERNGVKIDAGMLETQSQQLSERMTEIEQQAYDVAGEEFNLASPKQIQTIFFEKMELPVIRKTPKGQPSTAEDVLQELAEDFELPRLILEHRGLSKLKSTYTDKLPKLIDEKTGRVHTSYHQTGAATGRMSSSDPNLQNIPIRSEEGRRIRQAFVADEGNCILAADYSQIELRIMAHLSADKSLLKAFKEGQDIHRATAAEVFDVALDEVETEQRRAAKAINFGLIYGMSAFGLAKQLNVTRYQAQDYIDLYFDRYPGVKDYMDNTREQAHETGYVETLFGRRLYLPEINSRNGMRRQYAERTAINAPMQGTAADIIKRAMINVYNRLQETNISALIIMQVHDELVFEVAKDQVEALSTLLHEEMESAADLNVPLLVDIGVGINWDEAH
ncbi:MAG: DNA polymerase I [endosymbiont of Galathealinum brachiosum]|uniref:DNA polymerase I n=1 Tax=endosymbiont of Galathealinum brachiosum TaxID=2200906 RepID=A0A370DE44_9GAMM|nr:MAG: DNA polymerase I [endosymbiont of Galathealinum brachiosum]